MICCKTRYSHWSAAKLKKKKNTISPQNNCIYSKESYLRTLKWINFKFLRGRVYFIPTVHYFDSFLILQVLITAIQHHCKHTCTIVIKRKEHGEKKMETEKDNIGSKFVFKIKQKF